MRDILAWIVTVEALGLAALPILRRFFRNRTDAALLCRPLGLALVAYVAWAATLLPRIPFERRLLLIGLLLVAATSYAVHRKTRASHSRAPFWDAEDSRAAAWFWAATAVFLLIRAAVPEILGAEKFMDLAFLNSLAHHGAMPPLDPWMSGKTINYYYWGYLLAAVLAKLSSVSTFVSYNLAVATFAGYSFVAAACLTSRLARRRRGAALAGGLACVFAANVQGAVDAVRAPFAREFDYWHASRVIGSGDTINEFPFFTFFHADLHPHLLAFPFFLAALACAHRLSERDAAPETETGKLPSAWRQTVPFLFAALVAGTAIAANTWNAPALAIVFAFAGARRRRSPGARPLLRDLALGAGAGFAAVIGGLLLFRGYSATYRLPYSGMARTTQSSGLSEFLRVWGFFFAVAIPALWPVPADPSESSRRSRDLRLAGTAGVSLLAAIAFGKPALLPIVFLGLLALPSLLRGWSSEDGTAPVFALFLMLLALAMIAGCEFVYLKDSYGLQLQRMNTIFKFYHQAWPLSAVALVAIVERVWVGAGSRARAVRTLATAAGVAALLYPANAAVSRLRQRDGAFSLDAFPALARRSPGDAAAVAWLEQNAASRSVLLEASGDPYREFARISSHTGLPTVMGWSNHEGLWRSNDPEVAARFELVRAFYTAADEESAFEIVKKFGVTHVVLGDLEKATYPRAAHIAAFLFLEPALPGTTTVYRVRSLS